ncbi:MAG: polymer-forming cytoskeletal protein [Chitinispirillaceae bacterium]|nr:polymer-forming cytoskeletal protein [Chitinispirillaceae bacterium]
MKSKIASAIFLVFCCTFTITAMVIHNDLKSDSGRARSEPGVFNEDYLFMGNDLKFSGQAEDLLFLGRKLNFSGKTTLGTFAICQDVSFSGNAGNGVMVACMDIDITGKITGNNYIACRALEIGENAAIQGNLFAACADIEINGRLDGSLYTATNQLIINNEIQGNVTAYARHISIGEKGRINGTFTYTARKELSKAEQERITGTIKREKRFQSGKRLVPSKKATGYFARLALLISYIIVGLLLLFLPAFRSLDSQKSERSFWYTALWGLIPQLIYPALIALSFILVVTIPFGFVLIFAFVPLMYLAGIIGAVVLGKYLTTKFAWQVQKRHYHFLIGALVLAVLSFIPFFNILVWLFVEALGWGMYVSFLFKKEL